MLRNVSSSLCHKNDSLVSGNMKLKELKTMEHDLSVSNLYKCLVYSNEFKFDKFA